TNKCGAVVMPNVDGTGYYRFTMGRDAWKALAGAMSTLNPGEQLATLHSLRAAFSAGDADAASYVTGLRPVAENGAWDGLELAREFAEEVRGDLIPRSDVPKFEQVVRGWLSPAMTQIGLEPKRGEVPSVALKRVALAEVLTKIARDPTIMTPLSAKGAAYLRAVAQS